MDTSEGPSYRGGRSYRGRGGGGGGRGGGFYHEDQYDHFRGGRGGGRGRGYYHDDGGQQYDNYNGGRGGGRYSNQYQQDYQGGRGDRGYSDGGRRGRGRGYQQNWGGGGQKRSNTWQRPQDEEQLPEEVKLLTELVGHTGRITTIQYDAAAGQLYTGSKEGTVRTWSTITGQSIACVEVGGEVDSLLLAGGYLFVGLHKGSEGMIKVWNMSTGANHVLTGHKGAVYALVIANNALVSGGEDNTIRVWNYNTQAQIFMSQAIINKESGGHASSVLALCVSGPYMFSADRFGDIRVWDLNTGGTAQTLLKAHANAITQLLVYDDYVLSSSIDGTIKCWQMQAQPQMGAVIGTQPQFTFNKDSPPDGEEQQQQRYRNRPPRGIITMTGTCDANGSPILMAAYNGESCVRLFGLPNFDRKGVLTPASDTFALGAVPSTVMFTGDANGKISVFAWQQSGQQPEPVQQ